MNRIEARFADLRREGRKGLVGFLTAGDPGPAESARHVRTALDNGVDVLELGVPFSDPTADGPVIQVAAQRALAAGMTVAGVLDLVRAVRPDYPDVPIVLFGYTNPFYRYGYERLCAEAAAAGVDGLLVVDMPFEESDELAGPLAEHDLCRIPLVAPTTPPARVPTILQGARGFVYYIMFRGVTGTRAELAGDLRQNVAALRAGTTLPIAVGFGVSTGAQARLAGEGADAVVVGSAFVAAAAAGQLAERVREIRAALDEPARGTPGLMGA